MSGDDDNDDISHRDIYVTDAISSSYVEPSTELIPMDVKAVTDMTVEVPIDMTVEVPTDMTVEVPTDTPTAAAVEGMKTSRKSSFRNGKLAAALLAGKTRRLQRQIQNPDGESAKDIENPQNDRGKSVGNPHAASNDDDAAAATQVTTRATHQSMILLSDKDKVSRLPASMMTKQQRLTRRCKGNPTV